MSARLAKAYVDRLLANGYEIDIIGTDNIVIVHPVEALSDVGPVELSTQLVLKKFIVAYLRKLGRVVELQNPVSACDGADNGDARKHMH